jgi:Cd2+/Zn2+-exporting ATPase
MYILAIVTGGYYTARAGFFAIRTLTLDINFLMIVAVAGAIYIGEWTEAAMVMFLFSLAAVLEGYAVEKSRKSIRSLMDLTPKEVRVKTEEGEKHIPVEDLQAGEIFVVRPGERIATDGEVIKGWSYVDQAPITGESKLVGKGEGDEVFGGSINQQGFLEIRATRDVSCNTLAEIIHLVEKAQSRKATTQRFVDKFARVYTPIMLVLALLVVAVPVLVFRQNFESWLYSSLVLLVISCPCALVISTPIAIVSAITNAAKNGILIKGGSYLEAMSAVQAIAFDKTGTITEGRPRVKKIVSQNGYPEQEILRIAAGLERQSEHHLARAILQKAEVDGVSIPAETEAFEAIKGKGAKGIIENKTYYIGNQALLEEILPADQRAVDLDGIDGSTIVFVASEDELMGIILLEDRPRHQSKGAIDALKQQGIKSVTMLTGDNAANAKKVAQGVGITDVQANLLPGQKVEAVQELLETYKAVAMVGDGINDAPALATATVGIAMGGVGMDVSLETADVVLMSDDPASVAHTVILSRRTLRIIRENIIIALGLKVGVFILALFSLATLWMAVFADTGASLIVIANSLRLLFMENQVKSPPRLA